MSAALHLPLLAWVCFIFMPLHLQPLSGVELLNPFTSLLDLFFTASAALVRLLAFSL